MTFKFIKTYLFKFIFYFDQMTEPIAFVSDISKFRDLRYRNKPIIAEFYTE